MNLRGPRRTRGTRLLFALIFGAICLGTFFFSRDLSAQYSLRFTLPKGENFGSGFVVSAEGYIVTSFQLAQNATAGKLVTGQNQSLDLAGWVAADKSRDLLIVAVKNPPKNLRPWPLDVAGPAEGAEVVVAAGVRSKPLAQQWLDNVPKELLDSGHLFADTVRGVRPAGIVAPPPALPAIPPLLVNRRWSGAELLAGLPARDADTPGGTPNAEYFTLNLSLEPSYVGAPVRAANSDKVLGMIAGLIDGQGRLRIGISARHIAALLPQGKVVVKPFGQLKKYEDPVDPAAAPAAGATAVTNYHLSLADRFVAYNDRLTEWERGVGELRKSVGNSNNKLVDLRTKLDKIAADIQQIQGNPEETFRTTEVREVKAKDKNDKGPRTERVTVTSRRLSAGQQQSISDLADERLEAGKKLRELWFGWNHDNKFELPLAERRLERGRQELFYLVDPFELRSEEQHRELLLRLDDAIGEGGAPGTYYLARGLCKLRLRKTAEAAADFHEAIDVDGGLEQLAAAADGRRWIVEGDTSKGAALVGKAARLAPDSAAVLFLAARAEVDKKAFGQATRGLLAALDKGAAPAETHSALAWLFATTSAGDSTHGRAALLHARQACFATEDNDWLSLAALAAAHAKNSEFDRAAVAIDRAKLLAPLDAHDLCDQWKAAIDAKQPIERDWR